MVALDRTKTSGFSGIVRQRLVLTEQHLKSSPLSRSIVSTALNRLENIDAKLEAAPNTRQRFRKTAGPVLELDDPDKLSRAAAVIAPEVFALNRAVLAKNRAATMPSLFAFEHARDIALGSLSLSFFTDSRIGAIVVPHDQQSSDIIRNALENIVASRYFQRNYKAALTSLTCIRTANELEMDGNEMTVGRASPIMSGLIEIVPYNVPKGNDHEQAYGLLNELSILHEARHQQQFKMPLFLNFDHDIDAVFDYEGEEIDTISFLGEIDARILQIEYLLRENRRIDDIATRLELIGFLTENWASLRNQLPDFCRSSSLVSDDDGISKLCREALDAFTKLDSLKRKLEKHLS